MFRREQVLILAILADYSLMGSQLINDDKTLNCSPFFPNAFGNNRGKRRDGFAEELNTYDLITTNAGIFFDVTTSPSDRRGLRTIAQNNSRFLFEASVSVRLV